MSRQPITPKTPPPPPAGPRPTGNPQPIVPKPNGGKPKGLLAELLAALVADARYHYRVMELSLMPLGLGQCRQRIDRITQRTTYWWRYADSASWWLLRPGGVDELPRCRDTAEIARLLVRAS